jgi:penicillin-binding protein 1A
VRTLQPSEYKAFLESQGVLPQGPANATLALFTDKGSWYAAPVDSPAVAARGGAPAAPLQEDGRPAPVPADAAWRPAPRPDAWFQVLVRSVKEDGATVQVSGAIAWMDVASMHWCRPLDPSKATEEVPSIKDARKVLKPGDVVWASVDLPADGPDFAARHKGAEGGAARLNLLLRQMPDVQGAVVSLEPPTGDVVALVGGYSFETSQFNRATQATRQPGSAFKPIVYSTAIDNGLTAASMVLDAPFVYTDFSTDTIWRPENFEGVFYGPTLLRTALAKSRNLCTIRVAQKIGIPRIVERAKLLGLQAEFPTNLSVALGSVAVTPVNLCQAFTAFARDGSTVTPRIIREVRSAWGEPLYQAPVQVNPGISPQTAYIMASLLKEVVRDGTGWRARALGRPIAGKTGTSNDEQDAWFMGFTPYLLTGVYVGFDQVAPMGKYETGARAASPIWVDYRTKVESDYPEQDFPEPPGIVHVRIDAENGQVAGPESTESYFLPFKVGTQPTQMAGRPAERSEDTSASGEELLKQVF